MSLFNPWVILGLLLAFAGVGAGGYSKGVHSERDRQQIEIARLNNEARQKEQALVSAVTTQATQLVKANNDAKLAQQKRNSDIDSGALKLRIPVKTPLCPVPASTDAAATSGANLGDSTAELDGETSKALIALTAEGDAAIRKFNTCVNLYNEALQTLKGKP